MDDQEKENQNTPENKDVESKDSEAKSPEATPVEAGEAKEKAPEASEASKEEAKPEAAATEESSDSDEDDLTGIEEASEEEIVEKVTKKTRRKKKRDRFQDKSKAEAPEWIEKVIQIRRVTKVVKGGKKLSFRAVVIVGNAKGQVGVGVGKAAEVIGAIQKAVAHAKKGLVTVPLIGATIPHQIIGREGAARVLLKPAREGTGIIAGGAARTVLELGGVGDILSKSLGSRNPLNVARATLDGLKSVRTFKEVAKLRGKEMKDLLEVAAS